MKTALKKYIPLIFFFGIIGDWVINYQVHYIDRLLPYESIELNSIYGHCYGIHKSKITIRRIGDNYKLTYQSAPRTSSKILTEKEIIAWKKVEERIWNWDEKLFEEYYCFTKQTIQIKFRFSTKKIENKACGYSLIGDFTDVIKASFEESPED